ncbi:MAG: DUF2339 domain-containing protein, partial [Gemmatimonadota bacterium]|nr:DUF2339 domain-containing protein [Gemmatimonadota bacterium]
MSDSDRLDRLEHRLEVLEGLVRRLLADLPATTPRPSRPAPPPPAPLEAPVAEVVVPPPHRHHHHAPRAARHLPEFSEQWLGQRGLLAVGVVFVILAAGFLLKLSFDRGWISPLMRCTGGAVAGFGLGALGWRLHGKGVRVYGAALIGAGAAIVYLAVWAAAQLYALVPPYPALAALALVSVGLSAVAIAINQQALGASAVLGALFAPMLVRAEPSSMNLLLAYLASVGGGLGAVAATRQWRVAAGLTVLLTFVLPLAGPFRDASPWALYAYAIATGAAWLYVGLARGWVESRMLAFAGGWTLLFAANGIATDRWPTALGAAILAAPVWWRAYRERLVWPLAEGRASNAESFYFYLTPILLGAALGEALPDFLTRHGGFVAAVVGVSYLVAGLQSGLASFRTVSALAIGFATLLEWGGTVAVPILLIQALAWAGGDQRGKRVDGRWFAVTLLAAALNRLWSYAMAGRPAADAAFTGSWALALWGAVAATALLAAGVVRDPGRSEPGGEVRFRPGLWVVAGTLLLFGVTVEIIRAFEQSALPAATQALAGGLSVSAWWIIGAAACFVVGFRRSLRPLRVAGFVVAGLALGKVILVDLSTLDALYRVGSALILGVVSLAVAYAYHRLS